MRLVSLIVVWVAFTVWSFWRVADDGLMGLFALAAIPWGQQVGVDLILSLIIAWQFMTPDGRRLGLRVWPWWIATVALGSIGVLAYLVRRELHVCAMRAS